MSDNAVGAYHTFFWERGRMRDVGTLTRGHSSGLRLNNRAKVVGQADPGVAFLWRQGRMSSLGFLQSNSGRAESINKIGEIVGVGFDGVGEKHAVIWVEGPQQITARWINPGEYE